VVVVPGAEVVTVSVEGGWPSADADGSVTGLDGDAELLRVLSSLHAAMTIETEPMRNMRREIGGMAVSLAYS
jgi:hypothetical protein